MGIFGDCLKEGAYLTETLRTRLGTELDLYGTKPLRYAGGV